MQVSSISNDLAFSGERRKKLPVRTKVDALINLDDNSVRQIAYLKTMSRFDERKYKRQNNLLFGLIPVAAGVSHALNQPMQFNSLKGAANRLLNGARGFGIWGGLLAVGALVGAGVNKLAKKSENYREFDNNNKFLSFLTTAAVAVGAAIGLRKGVNAILYSPKVNNGIINAFNKYGQKFNENKLVARVSNWASKNSSKMSDAFKDFVKTVAYASPAALLIGGWAHSTTTANAVRNDAANNYSELKNKQIKIAQHRVRELSVQNDLLLLNNEANQEELGEFMHALRKGRALERRQA